MLVLVLVLVKVSESSLTAIPALEQKLSLMMLILTVNELSESFTSIGTFLSLSYCPAMLKAYGLYKFAGLATATKSTMKTLQAVNPPKRIKPSSGLGLCFGQAQARPGQILASIDLDWPGLGWGLARKNAEAMIASAFLDFRRAIERLALNFCES